METLKQVRRRRAWLGVAVAAPVLVFAAAVAWVTLGLRNRLLEQLLVREAESLRAVAELQTTLLREEGEELGIPELPDDAFRAALQASRLQGVLAVRLFDAEGFPLEGLPESVTAEPPRADLMARAAGGGAGAELHRPGDAGGVWPLAGEEPRALPLLEAVVPLGGGGTVAVFWMDGRAVAAEAARVDRELAVQAVAVVVAGGALLAGGLGLAAARLRRAWAELERRNEDLAGANRELARGARISALGAVTAHLLHGLRNPLGGLEVWAAEEARGGEGGGEERREAVATTRRLRRMVEEVAAIVREERTGGGAPVAIGEFAAWVRERSGGGGVEVSVSGAGSLGGREANLLLLAVGNLVDNAREATRQRGAVWVEVAGESDEVVVHVRDSGPGLPPARVAAPFDPAPRGGGGGAGIGLAISRQLVASAGGVLELVATSAGGTHFRARVAAAGSRGGGGGAASVEGANGGGGRARLWLFRT